MMRDLNAKKTKDSAAVTKAKADDQNEDKVILVTFSRLD
jgi:hypothetical protein